MESGDDELGGVGGVIGLTRQHFGNSGAVSGVKGCVNFVKEVEGGGV